MDWMGVSEAPDYELLPLDLCGETLKLLSGDDVSYMSRDELRHRVVTLQTFRQGLDALIAVTMAEADAAGVPLDSRQRTMAQVMTSHTHAKPETVRADLRIGRFLRELPLLEDAVLDGRMSRDHVLHLQTKENIRVHHAMVRDQHLFVEWARDFEWPEFKQLFAEWLRVNDQDGPEPEDHDAQNTVTIRTQPDGRVKGNFDLDPVTGETLKQQLGNEESALFNEDNECGAARTTGQRRGQALANLIQRGAGRTETSAKPLIHVVMSLKVLMHAIEQLAKDEADQDFLSVLDPNSVDGRCELIDGTPIHPKYALVLAMQANLRRQVLSAKAVTLEASYETRAFPEWMRYIKLVETRGKCSTAGCDAHHTWLHADHRQPHSKHRETSLALLDMMCAPDNRHKSDGPQLRQRNDGDYELQWPKHDH